MRAIAALISRGERTLLSGRQYVDGEANMKWLVIILAFIFVSYLAVAVALGFVIGFLQIPFWISHELVVTAGGVVGAMMLMKLSGRERHRASEDRSRQP
jgi:predicted Abi (CAAX) family protease